MPLFAANLTMMFNEHPFLERFEAASKAGFTAVEYLFPYDYPAADLAMELEKHQLTQVLFNTPAGDWDAGERGLASIPGREQEFIDGIGMALEYAETLNCPRIHAMAGILPANANRTQRHNLYLRNLEAAARLCAEAGRELLIEPINPINMPGYFLNDFRQSCEVIDSLRQLNVTVMLQFDLFHCARIHGDVATWLTRCKDYTGHFQIAGIPDRHEPDVGELAYLDILNEIVELGQGNFAIGCEYIPQGLTTDGLQWLSTARSI
ncbi:hypothetical protein AB833_10775 [Chromatiales bacterium (ex Bugula neritina AB1)]|nr:hypothetical protein AB833_10775 [Chromatiales bacterium (ex Bugula neritina AB1)]